VSVDQAQAGDAERLIAKKVAKDDFNEAVQPSIHLLQMSCEMNIL
jgi:hypothetical protein